jgi:hypothetical protein
MLDWIVDRLCLQDWYEEINEVLGYLQHGSRYLTERQVADQDTAEKTRNVVYDFMISTQNLIHKPDLGSPFIFDLLILDKREIQITVQIGLASAHKIVEAKLTLKEQNVEKIVLNISGQIGLQNVQVKGLEKGKTLK